ncbi:zinc finger protein 831 [Polyodon spathula]|uniref:zinc finger protein 831 n=1 Tax=Polyodon spathula TaxID=7913 RepID=UPI001B7F7419|nr:zinc finger protein 831 [Polyodon spathula]
METSKQNRLCTPASSEPSVQDCLSQPGSSSSTALAEDGMQSKQKPLETVYLNTISLPLYQQFQPACSQETLSIHLSVPQLPERMGQAEHKQLLPTLTLRLVNGLPVVHSQGLLSITSGKPKSTGKHVCKHCGRDCLKPSVLEKHLRCHTGERPYPCATCGIAFKTQSNLYKHKRTQAHARLCSEPQGGSRDSAQSSKETSLESPFAGSYDGGNSKGSGSLKKETTICDVAPISTTSTQLELSEQSALVGVILAPVNRNQENTDQACGQLPGKQSMLGTTIDSRAEREGQSTQMPNRHIPLQRQEATFFSKQWDPRACSGKSQSHDSTDSGYLSHSESTEQQSWGSCSNSCVREHSMESLPETAMESQAEIAPSAAMNCSAEAAPYTSSNKPSALEKKQIEERISKLISDNDAVVDDKRLANVRPRKTVLSKQGSIDLPMPYTYKDSFHFDMKASKVTNTCGSWNRPTSRPKPGLFSSVPTQCSTSLDRLPITRSSSLPFSGSCLGLEGATVQSLYHQEGCSGGKGNSGHLHAGDFAARSVDLQASHPRSLVRQVAVDCVPAAEVTCPPAPLEEASQSSLGSEGEPAGLTNESSGGKGRRKKTPKFSYSKWYMYGDGTFRKLYQMEKGRNAELSGGGCRVRKSSGRAEASNSLEENKSMETHAGQGPAISGGVNRASTHQENLLYQPPSLPAKMSGFETKQGLPTLHGTDSEVPLCRYKTSAAPCNQSEREKSALPSNEVFSVRDTGSGKSIVCFQKPQQKWVANSQHQRLVRQCSLLLPELSNIKGSWAPKDICTVKEVDQSRKNTFCQSLSHLPSDRKKKKTDGIITTGGLPAEVSGSRDETQSCSSLKWLNSKTESRQNKILHSLGTPCDTKNEGVSMEGVENEPTHYQDLIGHHFHPGSAQHKETSPAQDTVMKIEASVPFQTKKPSFLPMYQLKLPQEGSQRTHSNAFPRSTEDTLQCLALTATTACLNLPGTSFSNLVPNKSRWDNHTKQEKEDSLLCGTLPSVCVKGLSMPAHVAEAEQGAKLPDSTQSGEAGSVSQDSPGKSVKGFHQAALSDKPQWASRIHEDSHTGYGLQKCFYQKEATPFICNAPLTLAHSLESCAGSSLQDALEQQQPAEILGQTPSHSTAHAETALQQSASQLQPSQFQVLSPPRNQHEGKGECFTQKDSTHHKHTEWLSKTLLSCTAQRDCNTDSRSTLFQGQNEMLHAVQQDEHTEKVSISTMQKVSHTEEMQLLEAPGQCEPFQGLSQPGSESKTACLETSIQNLLIQSSNQTFACFEYQLAEHFTQESCTQTQLTEQSIGKPNEPLQIQTQESFLYNIHVNKDHSQQLLGQTSNHKEILKCLKQDSFKQAEAGDCCKKLICEAQPDPHKNIVSREDFTEQKNDHGAPNTDQLYASDTPVSPDSTSSNKSFKELKQTSSSDTNPQHRHTEDVSRQYLGNNNHADDAISEDTSSQHTPFEESSSEATARTNCPEYDAEPVSCQVFSFLTLTNSQTLSSCKSPQYSHADIVPQKASIMTNPLLISTGEQDSNTDSVLLEASTGRHKSCQELSETSPSVANADSHTDNVLQEPSAQHKLIQAVSRAHLSDTEPRASNPGCIVQDALSQYKVVNNRLSTSTTELENNPGNELNPKDFCQNKLFEGFNQTLHLPLSTPRTMPGFKQVAPPCVSQKGNAAECTLQEHLPHTEYHSPQSPVPQLENTARAVLLEASTSSEPFQRISQWGSHANTDLQEGVGGPQLDRSLTQGPLLSLAQGKDDSGLLSCAMKWGPQAKLALQETILQKSPLWEALQSPLCRSTQIADEKEPTRKHEPVRALLQTLTSEILTLEPQGRLPGGEPESKQARGNDCLFSL